MSAPYSLIVRSLENLPEFATFKMAVRVPRTRIGIQLAQPLVRFEIGPEVRQVHVVVAACQQRFAQRPAFATVTTAKSIGAAENQCRLVELTVSLLRMWSLTTNTGLPI
jgi:hypothetical protein